MWGVTTSIYGEDWCNTWFCDRVEVLILHRYREVGAGLVRGAVVGRCNLRGVALGFKPGAVAVGYE